MTKYSAAEEMRTSVRDTFAEVMATQQNLRNYYTKNPPAVRTRKEMDEMASEGLSNDDGLITVMKSGEPASQAVIEKVMSRVDERMLTEGNPEMREHNFNYRGGKILPIAEVKE
jgi:hypothetical protein